MKVKFKRKEMTMKEMIIKMVKGYANATAISGIATPTGMVPVNYAQYLGR